MKPRHYSPSKDCEEESKEGKDCDETLRKTDNTENHRHLLGNAEKYPCGLEFFWNYSLNR